MVRYLIDENLPYYFKLWDNDQFEHVFDIKNIKTDNEIWEYAKKNQLIIITKDNDYFQ
jgi:predicted nuclease of predicted toxin-antitoxin system